MTLLHHIALDTKAEALLQMRALPYLQEVIDADNNDVYKLMIVMLVARVDPAIMGCYYGAAGDGKDLGGEWCFSAQTEEGWNHYLALECVAGPPTRFGLRSSNEADQGHRYEV